jgi:hypothetical protein
MTGNESKGSTGPVDFQMWAVDDPDGKLVVSANNILWSHADRTIFRQVRLEVAEDSIADFRHRLEVQISAAHAVSAEHSGLLRLWECRNNWANRMWIYARNDVDRMNSWTIHFEQKDESYGEWKWHGRVCLDLGSTYSVVLHRTNKYCRLQVSQPESLKKSIEDSGNIRCADTPYREVWVCSTLRTPYNKGNWSSGFIENLYLD